MQRVDWFVAHDAVELHNALGALIRSGQKIVQVVPQLDKRYVVISEPEEKSNEFVQ